MRPTICHHARQRIGTSTPELRVKAAEVDAHEYMFCWRMICAIPRHVWSRALICVALPAKDVDDSKSRGLGRYFS